MMGGLVGRYGLDANGGGDGDGQDFELAEPDELLGRCYNVFSERLNYQLIG